MKYVYYDKTTDFVYILDHESTEHGVLVGSLKHLPENYKFLVQALLTNAGYTGITGLTIVNDASA